MEQGKVNGITPEHAIVSLTASDDMPYHLFSSSLEKKLHNDDDDIW